MIGDLFKAQIAGACFLVVAGVSLALGCLDKKGDMKKKDVVAILFGCCVVQFIGMAWLFALLSGL